MIKTRVFSSRIGVVILFFIFTSITYFIYIMAMKHRLLTVWIVTSVLGASVCAILANHSLLGIMLVVLGAHILLSFWGLMGMIGPVAAGTIMLAGFGSFFPSDPDPPQSWQVQSCSSTWQENSSLITGNCTFRFVVAPTCRQGHGEIDLVGEINNKLFAQSYHWQGNTVTLPYLTVVSRCKYQCQWNFFTAISCDQDFWPSSQGHGDHNWPDAWANWWLQAWPFCLAHLLLLLADFGIPVWRWRKERRLQQKLAFALLGQKESTESTESVELGEWQSNLDPCEPINESKTNETND